MRRNLWIFVLFGLIVNRTAIGDEPKPPNLDTLRKQLHSTNSTVQILATQTLAAMGDKAAPAAADLVELLNDTPSLESQSRYQLTPSLSTEAMNALLKIGPAATNALGDAVKSDKKELRVNTIYMLIRMGGEKNLSLLPKLDALRDELHSGNAARQRLAAETLGAMGEFAAPAVADLIQLLDAPQFSESPNHVFIAAQDALLTMGPTASDALADALQSDKTQLRDNAIQMLVSMKPEKSFAALKRAASNSAPKVREMSITALSSLSTQEAVALRIAALKDSDEPVRLAAARGFSQLPQAVNNEGWNTGAMGPEILYQVVEALKPVLAHDEKAAVRIAAAKSLGELRYDDFGFRPSVAPLLKALKDDDSLVRVAAAEALGQLRDRSSVSALLELLTDKEPTVMVAAVVALGKVGDPLATKALIPFLTHKDGENPAYKLLPNRAAEALGHIRDRRAVPALIVALQGGDSTISADAAESLGKIGDPSAVPALIVALQGRDSAISTDAAAALGAIRDPRAVEPLLEFLRTREDVLRAREEEDQRCLQAVAWALGELRDPRAIKPLVDLMVKQEHKIKVGVAFALNNISDTGVVVALADVLVATEPSPENPFDSYSASYLASRAGDVHCKNYDTLKVWWAANRARYLAAAIDNPPATPAKKP